VKRHPTLPPGLSRGLRLDDEIVPGTDWILRDSSAWWVPGERGTRPRAAFRDLLCGHWTAGEATTRRYDDDGPAVVRGMKARKRPDGSPMQVGVEFVIGACEPDAEHAPIWQVADPALTAMVHVGRSVINARAIGVEVVSAGLPGRTDARHRPHVAHEVHGRLIEQLAFYPGQLATWVRLAETLAALEGRHGIAIPRRVPAELARALSLRELRAHSGAIEHLSVPPHRKVDAGTQLLRALVDAGWAVG
jgi:hypothetical protein